MMKVKKTLQRYGLLLLVVVACIGMVLPQFILQARAAIDGVSVDGLDISKTVGESWTVDGTNALHFEKASTFALITAVHYSTTLRFTNNTTETRVLSFNYNVDKGGGSVTLDGKDLSGNSSTSMALNPGAFVEINAVTGTSGWSYPKTKVYLTNISFTIPNVDITFAAPDSNMGTYSVNQANITSNLAVTNPANTTYAIQATPLDKYVFTGWYLNNNLVYTADTVPAATFTQTGTVTAGFAPDPLYTIAEVIPLADGSYSNKDDLVTINSRYYHNPSTVFAENIENSANGYDCYYSKTGTAGTANSLSTQYIPSLEWKLSGNSVVATGSGTATGQYETELNSRSWAYANQVTNVIQIYAKEDCVINIDYTLNASGGTTFPALRYLDSTSANESIANIPIELDQKKAESDGTFECTLSKGHYLYIYTNSHFSDQALGGLEATIDYSLTSTITKFTVQKNEVKYTHSSTIQDNVETVLPGGSLRINDVIYGVNSEGKPVDASGNPVTLEYPQGQAMRLAVASCPTNYYFLGWMVNGNINDLHCTPTYEYTITEDTTVDPIFVPGHVSLDITTDPTTQEKVYTYTYLDMAGNPAPVSGQYIARNPECTAFYETLAEGFAANGEVVLLGNMTIKGPFEVPSNEVLVVPCSMGEVFTVSDGVYGPITVNAQPGVSTYARLTLDGNVTVNGSLLVSGYQFSATGSHSNPQGSMTLSEKTTVTVSKNGALYAYGFVEGNGTIIAKGDGTSGAQIHEFCDIPAVPHPVVMQSLVESKYIMPMNVYYLNSIRSKTKYEPGATLEGHIAFQYDDITKASLRIIGPSNSCFTVTSGTATKYFDPVLGQIVMNVDPGAKVETNAFKLSITATLGIPYTLKMESQNFILPLANGWSLSVEGTMNIKHGFKMLPGSVLDVKQGGKVEITGNGKLIMYRLNDYDYRYNGVADDEHLGFNVSGYPVNVGGYYNFGIGNVGSAKLNVDGELYANGKLFVTESLIGVRTETDSKFAYKNYTHYANGFNNLTGTGMIVMGNGSASKIQEHTIHHSNRDATTADVTIVPMKGLPYGATRDGLALPVDLTNDPQGNGEYVALTGTVYGMEAIGTDVNGNPNQTIYVWTSDPCQAGRHTDKADGNLECDNCGTKLAKLAVMNAYADSTTELVLKFQLHDSLLNSEKTGFADGVSASVAFTLPASETRRYTTDFEDGLFVITQPIASGEMTKPVEVSFKNGEVVVPIVSGMDGTCVNSLSRTVVDYAKALLSLTEADVVDPAVLEKQKTFIRALLTYGSYAQNFFTGQEGYSDLDGLPATSDALDTLVGLEAIPDSYQVVRPETSNNGIQYLNQQAYLGSAIKLRVYFNTIDGYTFTVNFGGREYAVSASTNAEGECYVDILNIPAAYLNEVYTITATNGSGSYVVKTSVMAFLNSAVTSKPNLTNLAQAMWVYNQAAREFFGLEVGDA